MNGNIVAVNRNLGVVVVEMTTQMCVVLQATRLLSLTIGEELDGDWNATDETLVQNLTSGDPFHAHVLLVNVTRSEAVGTMSFV